MMPVLAVCMRRAKLRQPPLGLSKVVYRDNNCKVVNALNNNNARKAPRKMLKNIPVPRTLREKKHDHLSSRFEKEIRFFEKETMAAGESVPTTDKTKIDQVSQMEETKRNNAHSVKGTKTVTIPLAKGTKNDDTKAKRMKTKKILGIMKDSNEKATPRNKIVPRGRLPVPGCSKVLPAPCCPKKLPRPASSRGQSNANAIHDLIRQFEDGQTMTKTVHELIRQFEDINKNLDNLKDKFQTKAVKERIVTTLASIKRAVTDSEGREEMNTFTEVIGGEECIVNGIEITSDLPEEDEEIEMADIPFDDRLSLPDMENTYDFYRSEIASRQGIFKAIAVLGDLLLDGNVDGDAKEWQNHLDRLEADIKAWKKRCKRSDKMFEEGRQILGVHERKRHWKVKGEKARVSNEVDDYVQGETKTFLDSVKSICPCPCPCIREPESE